MAESQKNLYQLSVQYSKEPVMAYNTSTGELVYVNLDNVYKRYDVRDKVILRIDITKQLTAGILVDNADEEIRRRYLSVVFGLVDDIKEKSEILQDIYMKDDNFKLFIGNICYFRLPQNTNISLLGYLEDFNRRRREMITMEFEQRSVMSSSGVFIKTLWYMYVPINDREDSVCRIPEEYKTEVLSYAKKWNSQYPRTV